MIQALCWLAARFSRLSFVVADRGGVLVFISGPDPSRIRGLTRRVLSFCRCIKGKETLRFAPDLGTLERARFADSGKLRAEFMSGSFLKWKVSVMREMADLSSFRARLQAGR
jgi:hypothetical protein